MSFSSPRATDGPATGRCMIVVTPDAQRTMNTYLGASSLLGPDHLDLDVVRASKVTFLEGYLFDRDEAKDAYRVAAEAAHEAGREVALSLSDGFCVDRHRDDFLALITSGVDILFANEDEITRLYEVDDFDEAAGEGPRAAARSPASPGREGLGGGVRRRGPRDRPPRRPPAGRHDRRRRPVRRRLPVRLHPGHAPRRLRATRLDRRRRGDRPHGRPARACRSTS